MTALARRRHSRPRSANETACALADDEVIEDADVDEGERALQRLGQELVGARRLGGARRMVVRQDHRRGAELERALDDLARIDARLRQRAAEHLLEAQQPALRVEEEDGEDLVLAAAELQLQVLLDLGRRIEERPRRELGGDRAARELEHRRDLGALGRAEALDPLQLLGLGAQQSGEAAEGAEQLLGELQHAGADQAGAQQQGDQLGVGERRRPEGEQLFARSGRGGNVLEHGGSNRRHRPRLVKCDPVYLPKGARLEARRARLLPHLALPPCATATASRSSTPSATPPATLSLGTGELAPAMEARLLGLVAGSEQSFALAAGEAFGERDPALVHRVSRAALDAEGDADGDYRIGDVVRFPAPDGQSIAGVVRDVEDDALVFDFNHPLAGRAVTFDVKLIGVL